MNRVSSKNLGKCILGRVSGGRWVGRFAPAREHVEVYAAFICVGEGVRLCHGALPGAWGQASGANSLPLPLVSGIRGLTQEKLFTHQAIPAALRFAFWRGLKQQVPMILLSSPTPNDWVTGTYSHPRAGILGRHSHPQDHLPSS